MEPRKKALELIKISFDPLAVATGFEAGVKSKRELFITIQNISKGIATRFVTEIQRTNPTIKGTSTDLCTMIVQTKAYWIRVQEEIDKM